MRGAGAAREQRHNQYNPYRWYYLPPSLLPTPPAYQVQSIVCIVVIVSMMSCVLVVVVVCIVCDVLIVPHVLIVLDIHIVTRMVVCLIESNTGVGLIIPKLPVMPNAYPRPSARLAPSDFEGMPRQSISIDLS